MFIFCCRIRNLISCFLVVYFILTVVRHSTSITECVDKIHEVFRLRVTPGMNKKYYYRYAITYLRKVKPDNDFENSLIIEQGVDVTSKYLLYSGDTSNTSNTEHGTVFDNEFAFNYYDHISTKCDLELSPIDSPEKFCRTYMGKELQCLETLLYYGLVGTKEEVVLNAHLKIVRLDITSTTINFRNDITNVPEVKGYALAYLDHIADNIRTKRYGMKYPKEYCEQEEKKNTRRTRVHERLITHIYGGKNISD